MATISLTNITHLSGEPNFLNPIDIKATDVTFNVHIHFSKKDLNFFQACKYYRNQEIESMLASIHHLGGALNRVHPTYSNKPETPTQQKILVERIAALAKDRANEKTYQFYRVVITFETTYEKSLQCCCGLIGPSRYELNRMGDSICKILRECIALYGGALQNHHTVRVAHDKATLHEMQL